MFTNSEIITDVEEAANMTQDFVLKDETIGDDGDSKGTKISIIVLSVLFFVALFIIIAVIIMVKDKKSKAKVENSNEL